MKISLILLICVLFSLLLSCNNQNNHPTANSKNFDYYQYFEFDLTKFDIPATIMLPDETVGIGTSFVPEVKHNEADFLWELNIGPNFVFLIEDFGDVKDLVKTHKTKILDVQNSVYKTTILIDDPELLVYQRALKENSKKTSPSFHAYAQKKINGIYYEFKTPESGYSKKIIEHIEKSFRSIKERKIQ